MPEYDVPPFAASLTTRRSSPTYDMHTYWAKKPHAAIRRYVLHYTRARDVVLDPFCGSGGTALVAAMLGRQAIAVDRSPAAAFIARNQCRSVDPEGLRRAGARVRARVRDEMAWLYGARCGRCGAAGEIAYTVLEKHGKAMSCDATRVGVECGGGCRPAREARALDDGDRARLAAIEGEPLAWWAPDEPMMHVEGGSRPWGAEWREGRNFRTVAELYTRRNLRALAALRAAILGEDEAWREALLFCFSSILLKCSRLMAHNRDGVGRVQKGTYYVPAVGHDVNVGRFFDEAVADMARGYAAIGAIEAPRVVCGSATRLDLADESVDYVFTDPPYGGKVQFGELNFVWEAWLGLDTRWHDEEIVVNGVRGKTVDDWARDLAAALRECARVLKPGRALSLCYADGSAGTWPILQEILFEAGFEPERVDGAVTIEAAARTTNQYFSDKADRRDLVINLRRARAGAGVRARDRSDVPFDVRARGLVAEFLRANPGASKDRVWDDLAARLVRSGTMERHDFDALLADVAEARGIDERGARRWFCRR